MGRGLSLHKTKSRCGALEASRKLYKSRKGGPQDQHHSGTTKEPIPKSSASPEETPGTEESKKANKQLAVESKDQGVEDHDKTLSKSNIKAKTSTKKVQQKLDTILIVDDDIEREIKASVLSESTSMQRKPQLAKPKLDQRMKQRAAKTYSRDIRSFVTVTKPLENGNQPPRSISKDSNAEVQVKREALPQKERSTSSTQGQVHSPRKKLKNPIKEDPAVTPSNLDDTRRVVAGSSVLGTTAGQNSPGVIECKSFKQKILPSHDTRRVVVSSGAYCATAGRDPPSVRDSVRTKGQRWFCLDDTRRVVASSSANGTAAGQNPPGVKGSRINQTRYHQDDIRRFVVADGAKCTEDGQKSLNAKEKQDEEFSA